MHVTEKTTNNGAVLSIAVLGVQGVAQSGERENGGGRRKSIQCIHDIDSSGRKRSRTNNFGRPVDQL